MKFSNRIVSRVLGGLIAVVLGFFGVVVGATAANAAVLTNVISGLSIRETEVGLNGVIHVDFKWAVPDDAVPGDTFTLTLSDNVALTDGAKFYLKDGNGNPIAIGVVSGQTITYTLTQYADDFDGIHGTGFVGVKWDKDKVTPGTTENIVVKSATETVTRPVGIPAQGPILVAHKSMHWVLKPEELGYPAKDNLVWSIFTPIFTAADIGKKVVVEDIGGTGQAIDCTTITKVQGDLTAGGIPRELGAFAGPFTLDTCDTATAKIGFTVTAALVDHFVVLKGASEATDPDQTEFTNTGRVRIDGVGTVIRGHAIRPYGGGVGEGYMAVSVGDYVWFDTNKNGLQDAGEPPLKGVKLTLVGPDGKSVKNVLGATVAPMLTDANGKYLFSKLPALPAGKHYKVIVTPPAGYVPTIVVDSDRARNSSVGSATSVDLTKNRQSDLTLDFGFVKAAVRTTPPVTTPSLPHTGVNSGQGILIGVGFLLILLGGASLAAARTSGLRD